MCFSFSLFIQSGWEFHAYVLMKKLNGDDTIYEPFEKLTLPLKQGVFGIKSMKEVFRVLIVKK